MKTLLLLAAGAGAAYYVMRDGEPVRAPRRISQRKIDRSKWPKKEQDRYKREVHKVCDGDKHGFKSCAEDFEAGIDIRLGSSTR